MHTQTSVFSDSAVIERLKDLFSDSTSFSTELLQDVYADDVVFVDPVHRVDGLPALQHYFERVYQNVNQCRFEFTGELQGKDELVLRWVMHVSHPRLQRGQTVSVRGTSWLQASASDAGKIGYHEDYYDMGALVYEQIPVLRQLIVHIKGKLKN